MRLTRILIGAGLGAALFVFYLLLIGARHDAPCINTITKQPCNAGYTVARP